MTTDVDEGIRFVDPYEADATWRVCLWAPPGEGKSVGAASAPAPVVVLSADRPGAYRYARRHFKGKDIRETRYTDSNSLSNLYRYLREHPEVRTVVIDPFHNIYDKLVDSALKRSDGDPDYQAVNKKVLGFLYSLRDFDVNVVLVAHEKINDGKRGDGKIYPQLGGPSLINKISAECDIIARVQREVDQDGNASFMAQLQPVGTLVCKESTGVLGARRSVDLTEWFALANAAQDADRPSEADIPFSDEFVPDAASAPIAAPDVDLLAKAMVDAQAVIGLGLKTNASMVLLAVEHGAQDTSSVTAALASMTDEGLSNLVAALESMAPEGATV